MMNGAEIKIIPCQGPAALTAKYLSELFRKHCEILIALNTVN